VWVSLMADIPDDLVARCVEQVVKRDGELDNAEAGRKMTAHAADDVDHTVTYILRELGQLLFFEQANVRRTIDRI